VREFLHNTPDINETAFDEFLRGRSYFKNNPKETVEGWTNRLDRAVPVGQGAFNGAPKPPEPVVNLLNSASATLAPSSGNMLNSDAWQENMLNAESGLKRAGY
jgi:hypothetical protein